MNMHCTANHGFRYCVEVEDNEEREDFSSLLNRLKHILIILATTVFFLLLFVML